MGLGRFYNDNVLPLIVEKACSAPGVMRLRPKATDALFGTVVEIGFGAGPNVEFYPATVERVLAVEPSELSRHRAMRRIGRRPIDVEFVGIDGERLPLDDDVADSALVTFTLCTIPDVDAALAELRRVLKPKAPLFALEHGLAPDARVARLQRRLTPIQRRVAGGCHLDRDPVALLTAAGFTDLKVSQQYLRSTPKFIGYTSLISATSPD
ncbi:MAG: methyltransferase domain-containing protein [Actinobacteria bacterium]|nr:methyltransferase domain-containing protein [Actinomycetota bacterium]